MAENITMYVVSHTHWDREWYESFQNYRFRLVRLMDDLLDILEKQDDYKVFHLDGQTIVLEDYLEIRPKNLDRIKKLIADKKLIIGPWYVMPDEFLVSGESLVRNLQKGIEICKSYNTDYMNNGYVTDIFGHNGQFPQILNGFGINSATLFRGVGNFPSDLFKWEGVDGSEVTAYRMDPDRCYSNFYFSVRMPFEGKKFDETDFIKRAKEMVERSRKAGTCNAFLLMDGVDHVDAEPLVPYMIKLMNENISGITVKHANFQEYINAVESAEKDLQTIKGPLYKLGEKGLNNRVLKNVLSSMVHLKQANDDCETIITYWAEQLDFASQNLSKENNPQYLHINRDGFIKEAWKLILQNHPHDSICGCSISDVHRDNEYRFRQAKQIIERITIDAMEEISEKIDIPNTGSDFYFTVFNNSQSDLNKTSLFTFDLPLEVYRNFKIFDDAGNEIPYQIINLGDHYYKREAPLRKLIEFIPKEKCTIAAKINVPGNGYTVVSIKKYTDIGPGEGEYLAKHEYDKTRYLGTMRVSRNIWDNGKLTMEIAQNGTLTIFNKETKKSYSNILSYEDCADIGDGWDYVKPIMDKEILSICGECDVSVVSDGPFASVISIIRRIPIPVSSAQKGRSNESKMTSIRTTITMLKGSNCLQIKTNIKNESTNHRLRVLIPTELNSTEFFTLTPFDMQKWDVKKVDYSTFKEIETFVNPTQGVTFIKDEKDSVGIYTKGLYEVEVCECDRTIAVTLFRAFSNEVGQVGAELGHMFKDLEFEFALSFDNFKSPSQALIEGIEYKVGNRTCLTSSHSGELLTTKSFLKIDSEHSLLSSILTKESENNETQKNYLRLFNPTDFNDSVKITPGITIKKASVVDFNYNLIQNIDIYENQLSLILEPHKIVTIEFE